MSDSAKKRQFGFLPEEEEEETKPLVQMDTTNIRPKKSRTKAQGGGGKKRGPGRPPSTNPSKKGPGRPRTKKPSDKPLSEKLHSERGPDGRFTSVAVQPKN